MNSGENGKKLFPPHGGYKKLITYKVGLLIYDATFAFCNRWISKKDRTHDQMVQAARSGVANIAEGSAASATSKKTELKLTNVAKASQEELLFDFQSILRQHNLIEWDSEDPKVLFIRNARIDNLDELRELMRKILSDLSDTSDLSDRTAVFLEVACNTMITLINQEISLLDKQIAKLADDFLKNGGFSERMYHTRKSSRDNGGR